MKQFKRIMRLTELLCNYRMPKRYYYFMNRERTEDYLKYLIAAGEGNDNFHSEFNSSYLKEIDINPTKEIDKLPPLKALSLMFANFEYVFIDPDQEINHAAILAIHKERI